MTRAETLLVRARAVGARLATAESCTGGLVAGAITAVPGSSDILDRGFVVYSNDAKREMLGVSAKTLATYGAVSEEVAHEMAEGAIQRSRATVAVSITGIAGPGGSERKPEGRVCFGIARADRSVKTLTVEFGSQGRGTVRQLAAERALDLLIEAQS